MKIAVIGAGIFGCTTAIQAARKGHDVTIFEKNNDIMCGASSHNQFRMHRGYHYPRSEETARECQKGVQSFGLEYRQCLKGWSYGQRFYAIANEGSKTSANEYRDFCTRNNLPLDEDTIPTGLIDNCQLFASVQEGSYDAAILTSLVRNKLKDYKVEVKLNSSPRLNELQHFDHAVIATYSNLSEVSEELGLGSDCSYQFEICEKPIIQLPDKYKDFSCVVMDGPFCSLDPYGSTGLHLMGHVEHAIWNRSYGAYSVIPGQFKRLIGSGIVMGGKTTRFEEFIDSSRYYLPMLDEAEYMGSMWVVRAVLAGVDDTDERPSIVTKLSDNVTQIFSGKVPTACEAAQSVVSSLDKTDEKEELAA